MKHHITKQLLLALLLLLLGLSQFEGISKDTRTILTTGVSIVLMIGAVAYILYQASQKFVLALRNNTGVLKTIRAMFLSVLLIAFFGLGIPQSLVRSIEGNLRIESKSLSDSIKA